MPEYRPFPYKFLPKIGTQLGVTFGDPIPPEKFTVPLNTLRRSKHSFPRGVVKKSVRGTETQPKSGLRSEPHVRGWMDGTIVQTGGETLLDHEGAERRALMDEIRSEVTAIIQWSVEDLGRKVSGDKLNLPMLHRTGGSRDRGVH